VKRVGILGLASSGKTTLFEILMQGAGNRAAGAGRESLGAVRVPDTRVDRLVQLFQPKKTTYTQIQFVDTVATSVGAGKPGKGADLFSSVRNCDALLAVVRDFSDPAVPVEGGVDAERDLRTLDAELILNDLVIVETRLEKIEKELRIGNRKSEAEGVLLQRLREILESGRSLRGETFTVEERKLLRGFQLMAAKPLLVVLNQDESSTRSAPDVGPGALAVRLRAHLEREIVALPPEERETYRRELGVEEDGLSLVIRACYDLLGLISFFTVGPDEVRAWTLSRGETAVDAAGEIHTDLARGFIRAEVSNWESLIELNGIAGARAQGKLRLEGRDYVVQDGDCLEIRFNRT
jgi:ribosome-binding ATPase